MQNQQQWARFCHSLGVSKPCIPGFEFHLPINSIQINQIHTRRYQLPPPLTASSGSQFTRPSVTVSDGSLVTLATICVTNGHVALLSRIRGLLV